MSRSIILFILLISCKATTKESAQDSTLVSAIDTLQQPLRPSDQLHDADYGIYHFTFAVNETVGGYSLTYHLPDKKLYIYDNTMEEGLPVGTFPFSEDVNYDDGYFVEIPEATFNISDYNFDGYNDISVIRIAGSTNLWSDFYLFNPVTKRFVKNMTLSELTSPQIDSVNQTILFHENGGMAGGWYKTGVMRWTNDTIILIREEEQTSAEEDNEIFIRTIKTLNAEGQLVIASKVKIQKLDDAREKQCLLQGEWEEFDKSPMLIFATSADDVVRVDGRNGLCN